MRATKTLISVLLYSSLAFVLEAADWRPVLSEDLALKQSKTDANADAECLFRDVRIENSTTGSVTNATTTYLRFKIYNERGAAKYADRQIEYANDEHVSDVSARTIHPDGTIIDVKKDSIFNKMAVKKSGLKVHVIAFTFPSVEPGSIIEYRWTSNAGETLYRYYPLDVQTEFPVDEVTFHVKPAVSSFSSIPTMRMMPFHCTPTGGNRDGMGFVQYTVRNVPAYPDEPYPVPGLTAKQWILVYYEENDNSNQDKYWNAVGKNIYNAIKEHVKVNGDMKQAAADITANAKTDDEKLAALAEYCRKNIKNIWGPNTTTEEREAYKANNTSIDAFKRKVGTAEDIQNVFLALAQAAGYEAREARLATKTRFLFTPQIRSAFFLRTSDAAVRVNGKWKFYDVTTDALPPGTLHWPEQGVFALIADSKGSEWVQTPQLTSEDSKIQRIADLTLSPTGDLDGTVREIFWGNESIDWRLSHGHQNDSERETYIREQIKQRFADFDAKDIRVIISPDASKPVGVSYHLIEKASRSAPASASSCAPVSLPPANPRSLPTPSVSLRFSSTIPGASSIA